MRILMILTAGSGDQPSRPLSLDQVIEVYYLLQDAGAEVVIASSRGENPPVRGRREGSTQAASSIHRFRSDRAARDAISDTLKLEQIYPEDFDGAICIGVLEEPAHPDDVEVTLSLLKEFLAAGKAVAIAARELELAAKGSFGSLLITGDEIRAPSLASTAILAALNRPVDLDTVVGPPAVATGRNRSTKEKAMNKPSIVFAHGLWADGSCFQKLIPTLQADGHEVICSQHGLDSLKGDVECVARCFGRVSSPVVLVGHSYGGTLITHAGMDDRVAALVYIAALAPDETETSQGQQQKFPVTDVFSHIEVADGRIWLRPDGVGAFAGDLSEAEQKVVWATQSVPVPDLFMQKVDGVAWRSKPSWYIVATEDRTVHPELERFVAKRMGATTVELRASHVPMLSQPHAVLDVIRNAAAAVAAKGR